MFCETNISGLHVPCFCISELWWFYNCCCDQKKHFDFYILFGTARNYCKYVLSIHFRACCLGLVRESSSNCYNSKSSDSFGKQTTFIQHLDLSNENFTVSETEIIGNPALRYVGSLFFYAVGGHNRVSLICAFILSIIRILEH